MATVGGTVYASCAGSARRPGERTGGRLVGGRLERPRPGGVPERRRQKVEVHVTCVDGGPQFTLEGGAAASSAPSAPSPAAPTSTDSGGHGADDAPGDDSSGRGGGGHGSDG